MKRQSHWRNHLCRYQLGQWSDWTPVMPTWINRCDQPRLGQGTKAFKQRSCRGSSRRCLQLGPSERSERHTGPSRIAPKRITISIAPVAPVAPIIPVQPTVSILPCIPSAFRTTVSEPAECAAADLRCCPRWSQPTAAVWSRSQFIPQEEERPEPSRTFRRQRYCKWTVHGW